MFKIEIYQTNKKGKTFEATAANINAETSKDIASEIAEFAKAHYSLTTKLTKLGVKGQSKSRIKLSQAAIFKITCTEDETAVSFNVANFGEFVAKNLKNKKVNTAIELMVDFTQTFSHLWK